ncbi:Protein REVEILLE 2 [Capsicum annuum]|uniref:Protein REVEILLE 2 n=1 Tax=Capsicum annuum TaxID=4072 RepID=A0A2G2ZWL4_CAPAN|nr:Protein REVEILLE 2 [Capsicum annuum]
MMIAVASVLAYPLDKQRSPENPNYGKVKITINKHNKYPKIMFIPELQSCPGLKEEDREGYFEPSWFGIPSRPGPSLDRDKLGIRAWFMDLGAQDSLLPNAAMTSLERVLNEILQPTIRSLKRMTILRDNLFLPWMDAFIGQCKTCPNYLDLLMSWVVKFMNKVLYAREGARSMMDWTFVDFLWQVRVDVDVFEIKVLENEDENYHNFDPQSMQDKMLKVVSIFGAWHFGKLQAPDNFAAAAARNPVCNLGLMVELREKWTEEEQHRFLEALKSYSRALRQIEEYVGSKNAIQIHSHAQKFFAKVARDSVNDGDESLNMIGIPSPRPKKNPLHPYPRKMVNSPVANKAISVQPENSPSLNISGRESRSPDSILLEIGSGVSEYPVSEQQNSRFSPASCTTDVHTAYIIFAENDDETALCSYKEDELLHLRGTGAVNPEEWDSETPAALCSYKEDKLLHFRGTESVKLEEWDKVYQYDM